MSIFGSLTTGIAGLQAQSTALGHISDNIANSQTTGYKRVDTSFNSLVLQSNSRTHNPGGVIARPNFANNVAGNIQTVDRTTNLALRGQGFFSVSRLTEVNGRSVPMEERFYTRDGSFELNDERILVNKSGYALNGFVFNEATGAYSTAASPIQVTADVDAPVPTRNIELRANLPTDPTPGQPVQPTTIEIYDSAGTPRTITLGWRPGQVNDSWRLTIDAPGARGSLPLSGNLPGFPVSATSTSLTQGRYDRAQIEEVTFNAPAGSSIKIGDTYRVAVNGVEFAETITVNNAGSIANLTGVAQSLADKINGAVPPAGVTAIVQNGRLRLTSADPGVAFTLNTSVQNAVPTANSVPNGFTTTPATLSSPQQSSVTFAGSSVDIGDRFEIDLDNGTGRTYAVDVTSANIGQLRDLNGVVAALAAQVNANSGTDSVVATVSGNTLTLRGTRANDTFQVNRPATGVIGLTGTSSVGTSTVAATIQTTVLPFTAAAPASGQTYSVSVVDNSSGTIFSASYTATGLEPDQDTVLANLVADMNTQAAAAGLPAGYFTNNAVAAPNLSVSGPAGRTFSIQSPLAGFASTNPRITNAPAADNTAFISTVQGNIAGSTQEQRLSLSGVPGDVGAIYSVTLRSPTPVQATPTAAVGTYVQQAAVASSQITNIAYPPSRAVAVGEVFSVTVNGSPVALAPLTAGQVAANPTVDDVITNLFEPYLDANLPAGMVAHYAAGSGTLQLEGAVNTPFTVSAVDNISTQPESLNFDFSTVPATPNLGDRYAITVNGTTYSLLVNEQNQVNYPDRASVLNELINQVGNDFGSPVSATAMMTGGTTTGIYLTAKQSDTVLDPTQESPPIFNKTITYETTGEEVSLDEIAGKLALKVNQTSGMPLQAAAVGGVITLTGNLDGVPFYATPMAQTGNTPPHIGLTFGGRLPSGLDAPAGTLSALNTANVGEGNATVSAVTDSGAPAQISFTVDYGNGPQRITLDVGTFAEATGLTQFEGEAINVTSLLQDGSGQGTFRDVEIRENGDVVANYDNGRRRVIAQIPVVLFNNANALARETGNVFTETADSGRARFTETGLNGAGTIAASSLEGSNVDIASEFTKLIVAQRSYTANTRVITTTDEMLTETINLKR